MRHDLSIREAVLLFALLAFAMLQALAPVLVTDPDAWWHIATGRWIVEHHAIPYKDPFSVAGAGRPWQAYTWLFDLILYGFHKAFGGRGFVLFTAVLWMGIAAALYASARSRQHSPLHAVLLCAFTLLAADAMATPRPWLFSVLFLIVGLFLLTSMRAWWIPLLFVLWANLHIEFVYGLAVLALAAVCRRVDWRIVAASGLATLVNPYGWKLWQLIVEYSSHFGLAAYIAELRPPVWNAPGTLLLAAGLIGALVLLIRSGSRDAFTYLLLAFAAFVSFRARRDVWMAAIAVASTVAMERRGDTKVNWRPIAAGVACALLLLAFVWSRRVPENRTGRELAAAMPVEAAKFLSGRRATVFSTFDWGGYLIWSLPASKVFLDGRTNVHGMARTLQGFATWRGEDWQSDPELASADLVVAPQRATLRKALADSGRYRLLFEDDVSAVLERTDRIDGTGSSSIRTAAPMGNDDKGNNTRSQQ